MKIALIGAPGSGKTKLAKEIAKKLDLKIVDGYAEKWSKRTGLTVGFTGGYTHSLGVALDRVFEERKLEDNFVTCGSTLDSLLYMALMSLSDPNNVEFIRAKSYMEVLSMLFYDFWGYDHVFFCRLYAEEPDGTKEKSAEELLSGFELSGAIKYDSEVEATLKSFFNVKYTELPKDDRLKFVMETINDASQDK